ncbi:hypothetical protein ABEB36_015607 [Hypothenemus hampei]|uniref:Uncharacterized protein n=1 Tax=Hypothenemus hampei TaxID=57062 RepID=A0ABD1DZC1_HYPHA
MNITEYFEELISDYHECYRRQFDLDVRLIEENLLRLENHCFVLNRLLANVENELLQEKLNNLHSMVWELHSILENLFEERPTNITQYPGYVLTTVRNGGVGISRRKLFRCRQTFNFMERFITDEELRSSVQEILSITANVGEVYMLGALRAKGCNVPRWRVHEFCLTIFILPSQSNK